jgi:hypothetical protein
LSTGTKERSLPPTIINWCKNIIYNPSQIPGHPNRREIAEKMVEMETRMTEQMKMMEEIRRKVMIKYEGKATPQQMEYYIMMEMQAEAQKQMQQQMNKMMEAASKGAPLTS